MKSCQAVKLKKIAIVLFLVILLIAGYFAFLQKPETAAADWWDNSWLYRQTVGITNSGTVETDFQVMITVDTNTLITASKMQSDCDDIRVTDINGKLIPHWIEPTTCNTSATKIWTKVPSISTSGDTVYLYYGNSAVNSKSSTTDTFIREISGVQGAWDMDGTVGGISTGDTLADSSGNTNTGTASNVNTTGMAYASSQYEQGVDFDGVDDYVNAGNNSSLNITNALTVEAWIKYDNLDAGEGIIIAKKSGSVAGTGYAVSLRPTVNRAYVYGGGIATNAYAATIVDSNWHHFVWTINGTTGKIYEDGIDITIGSSVVEINTTTNDLFIGALQGTSTFFNGDIDNVRIYNQALTQARAETAMDM
jgi:hypothetical protein